MKMKYARRILLILVAVCALAFAYFYPHFVNKQEEAPKQSVVNKPEAASKQNEDREPEITPAPKASENPESTYKSEATNKPKETHKPEATKKPKTTHKPKATNKPKETHKPKATHKPKTTHKPKATHKPKTDKGKPGNAATAPVQTKAPGKTCTISINCTDILAHPERLVENKKELVPADGIILSAKTYEINDGDSVFDVLKKAVDENGIHIEYTFTPVYNSVYIEGIANLYEFDCGVMSGWKYSVNGVTPGVGCSSYILNDGDTIEFFYSAGE